MGVRPTSGTFCTHVPSGLPGSRPAALNWSIEVVDRELLALGAGRAALELVGRQLLDVGEHGVRVDGGQIGHGDRTGWWGR